MCAHEGRLWPCRGGIERYTMGADSVMREAFVSPFGHRVVDLRRSCATACFPRVAPLSLVRLMTHVTAGGTPTGRLPSGGGLPAVMQTAADCAAPHLAVFLRVLLVLGLGDGPGAR